MSRNGEKTIRNLPGLRELSGSDPRFAVAGRCALCGVLGLLLPWARVAESGAPFGMALVACAGPGLCGVSALAGSALGYLLSGGVEWGIRYIAAAVLVYTVAFVFQEVNVQHHRLFMPVAAGLVMAVTAFLGSFRTDTGGLAAAAGIFLESCLAFGGCYFYAEALGTEQCRTETDELRRLTAEIILCATVLMAFSRMTLWGMVSLGRVTGLLLLMVVASQGGALYGAAAGTVLGLAMDIGGAGSPFYAMAFAFIGLFAGAFGRSGRFPFVLCCMLSAALAVACVWGRETHPGLLPECFGAAVVFLLLPGSLLHRLGALLRPGCCGSGETGLRRFTAGKMQALGDAYGQLYDIVRTSLESDTNDENIALVFDRAADRVCLGCAFRNRCWNTDYMDTLSAMNDATRAMRDKGLLAAEDMPGFFREKCPSLAGFVSAVNGELRALAYRRQLRERLSESRSVAWGQYREMSLLLGRLASELSGAGGSEPMAQRRLERYLESREIQAQASVYREGGGRLRAVLEGPGLERLCREEDHLEQLSSVVGVRLCCPREESGTGRLVLMEAEPLAVSVGIAAMKKQGETVSGDKGSYFKTDGGVLCVLLSDGMGTGDEAARDSQQVVSILEKFLRSGAEPATAMKILNSVMLLRGGESWGFATVDLMCIDLFTGETCFYKYGAAPSYVKTGSRIRRVKGETLAAGLSLGEGTAPDTVRMKLHPGSTALIASDGVLPDRDDEWLKELLMQGFEDMKALSRTALREAEKRYGSGDDMTVLTVRVEERR